MNRRRAGDRALLGWLVVAALALMAAVGLVVWLNTATPLTPVPVASSPRA